MPPVCEPAANKYTKVDPCVRGILIISWTFGLLRKAIGATIGKDEEAAPGVGIPEHVDVDGAIGVPRDHTAHFRHMGHIKLHKCHRFLCNAMSKYILLIWLITTSDIMILHYRLFRHGTWWNRRNEKDDISIFDFTGPVPNNPVFMAIINLMTILLDPRGRGWGSS